MVQGHNLSGKPCGKIVALQHNQLRVGVEEGCSRMIQIAPAGEGWLMGTHGLLFVISRNIFYPKRNMSISCFLECFAFIGHNWEHFLPHLLRHFFWCGLGIQGEPYNCGVGNAWIFPPVYTMKI